MDNQGKGHMAINLSDFTIGYKSALPLVQRFNCSIGYGEMVALVGRNGSGKSTLIKTLAGLVQPISGTYLIYDQPFDEMPALRRARTISYVAAGTTQNPNLNVFELVSLGRHPYTNWMGGLSDDDREIIHSALDLVGMKNYINNQFFQLSDGEKQRVMIARALAQDTPVVLFDEPTAFLDLPNKFELIKLLSTLKESGKTILFSTHDLETAWLWADKFWVIHEKNLLEGAPEDLGLDGVFNRIFDESGLFYNSESHRFEFPASEIKEVYLESGDNEILNWTTRAFMRAGIKRVSDKSVSIHVELLDKGDRKRWRVRWDSDEKQFLTIYELINYLTHK